MNKAKKITGILAVALTLFFSTNTQAQDAAADNYDQGFRFGFGANAGVAVNDPYDFALGVDARWDPLESTCRHASLSIL